MFKVLNNWSPSTAAEVTPKPTSLSLGGTYVRIDLDVLITFMFLAAGEWDFGLWKDYGRPGYKLLRWGNIILNIKEKHTEELAVVHVTHGTLKRPITKAHVKRLLVGFPPVLEDPWGKSIFEPEDIVRGGWVVALGINAVRNPTKNKFFFPLYCDQQLEKEKEFSVFHRSIYRVHRFLVDVWTPAFATDPEATRLIGQTVDNLNTMFKHSTSSGITEMSFHWLGGAQQPTDQLAVEIIRHFNGPPVILEDAYSEFRTKWNDNLRIVLWTAAKGCTLCWDFLQKKQGAEIGSIFGQERLQRMKQSDLYLCGCGE